MKRKTPVRNIPKGRFRYAMNEERKHVRRATESFDIPFSGSRARIKSRDRHFIVTDYVYVLFSYSGQESATAKGRGKIIYRHYPMDRLRRD